MSQDFFQAESGQHIMFAYYQSMLVVEFIVDKFGMEALRGILADLGDGSLINEAIAAHTIPMEEVEISFRDAALVLATNFGNFFYWSVADPVEVNPVSSIAVAAFLKKNPRNFWALQSHLQHLIEKEQWATVVKQADRLIGLLPGYTGPGNGYGVKATAYRKMDDAEGELAALEEFASHSAEAFDSFNRLIDVGFETESWEIIIANAGRSTAINPFLERTHYCSACAYAALDNREAAVGAFEKSLKLAPTNPSEVNYRLARVLQPDNAARSKRHVMDALADSPRYRDAYALLRELNAQEIEKGAVSQPSRKGEARTSLERIQTNE